MRTFNRISILLLTVFSLFSCKKNQAIITPSNSQLLTQKSWILTNLRYKIDNNAWVDEFPTVQSCVKDNIYTYYSTSVLNVDEGSTKCNSADPQTNTTGVWSFQNGDTQLAITTSTLGTSVHNILTLNQNTLVYTFTDTINGSSLRTFEYTFGH